MAKAWRKLGMVVAVAVVTASPAFAGDPTLLLHVDNWARVPALILQGAQGIATDTYNAIGVNVLWTDNSQPAADAAMHVTVVLLSGDPERRVQGAALASENALGIAPPNSGRVYIFIDRLADLARTNDRPLRLVLGRVVAHEVGHQLLPGKGHSTSGIMRGKLDYRSGEPGFTTEEAASIRALLSATCRRASTR
jgi:hypothetical protein